MGYEYFTLVAFGELASYEGCTSDVDTNRLYNILGSGVSYTDEVIDL